MFTERTETKTYIVKEYYCDVCEKQLNRFDYTGYCKMCNKFLCQKCTEHIKYSTGDYDDYYCKRCWHIGEKYRKAIAELEDQIDKLEAEYSEECNNAN